MGSCAASGEKVPVAVNFMELQAPFELSWRKTNDGFSGGLGTMRGRFLAALTAGLALLTAGAGQGDDSDLTYAEQALREAKQKADGPSLLEFFRKRTLSEADRRRLEKAVGLLGADEFAVRRRAFADLRAAGRSALPLVRAAVKDPDPEVARSAEQLVQRLESGSELALTVAAARVLAARKPDGAVPALLAFLPSADDAYVRQVVLDSLTAAGLRGGRVDPALATALKDGQPLRRLAAAYVHGRGGSEARKALTPLLKDPDAGVRFQAASGLVRAGGKAAVLVLLALLDDGPPEVGWQAEDLLLRVAGDKAPPVSLGDTPAERARCRREWVAWWDAHKNRLDLAKVNFSDALRGLTLVCDCDTGKGTGGKLWEFGADGKERWQMTAVRTPVDVQVLPGGRLLVAEGSADVVTERDREGKVLWSHRTGGYATTGRRLPNGNTLISGYSEITEVTRDHKVVFSYKARGGSIYRAQRLRDGHLLFASNGQVVEIDRAGRQVHAVNIPGGTGIWTHVEPLPNGHYLVAQYSANKVIELDKAGKVHWQVTVRTPSSASRLPNGRVLVSAMDERRVVEFDRTGKEAWARKTDGRPFLVRRH
jgi:hypothetical protein